MSETNPAITVAMPIPLGDDSSEGRRIDGLPRGRVGGPSSPRPEAYRPSILDGFAEGDSISWRDVAVT